MNKLIERLEGLKSELYKEMVASGYRNDDLEDTVHVVLENALCLVQSMCESGEVVVPRFKVGQEVVCYNLPGKGAIVKGVVSYGAKYEISYIIGAEGVLYQFGEDLLHEAQAEAERRDKE